MRILAADDSKMARELVKELLQADGHELTQAVDGVDAVMKFYMDVPDILVLDIEMPKMNGYMVCRLIKEDPSVAHVPVVVLTSRDSASDRYWGRKSGADVYLSKKLIRTHLSEAVNAAATRRAFVDLSTSQVKKLANEGDVLTQVCWLLDRKLFEATVVADINTLASQRLSRSVAASKILDILTNFVDYDLGAIAFADGSLAYVVANRRVSGIELAGFKHNLARRVAHESKTPIDIDSEQTWQIEGTVDYDGTDVRRWESFISLPIRVRGQTVGVLAVAAPHAGLITGSVTAVLRLTNSPIGSILGAAAEGDEAITKDALAMLAAASQSQVA